MNWHQWWHLQRPNVEVGIVVGFCVGSFFLLLRKVFRAETPISYEEFNARLRQRMGNEKTQKEKDSNPR